MQHIQIQTDTVTLTFPLNNDQLHVLYRYISFYAEHNQGKHISHDSLL